MGFVEDSEELLMSQKSRKLSFPEFIEQRRLASEDRLCLSAGLGFFNVDVCNQAVFSICTDTDLNAGVQLRGSVCWGIRMFASGK